MSNNKKNLEKLEIKIEQNPSTKKITRDIKFTENSLHFDEITVISDLHIGLEEALYKQGLSMHLNEEKRLINKFKKIFQKNSPNTLVLNGDIVHEFGDIPKGLNKKVKKIIKFLEKNTDQLYLIKGSHDTMLPYLVKKNTFQEIKAGNTLISHGEKEKKTKTEIHIIGHEHPAIEIEGERKPCYLLAQQNSTKILVTPAFNKLIKGVTVNKMKKEDYMSPLLRKSSRIKPIIKTEKNELLQFPPIKKMEKYL